MAIPLRISHSTRTVGAPTEWDETTNGPCAGLTIRDELISGYPWMISAHEFTPEELARLVAGEPLLLGIVGSEHPVMFLHVGDWLTQGERE
jgi:hypothetical protein